MKNWVSRHSENFTLDCMPMASFNVTEAAKSGYRLAWRERHYLLYLAAVPFLIKFICHMAVVMLGWRSEFMKQALIMLPSFFAYGWMLAHVTRLIFLDQRWPFRSSGNEDQDRQMVADRAQGILAGMLAFVVVEFLLAGFLDAVYQLSIVSFDTEAAPTFVSAMLGALFMAGMIWIFRYCWFYIPAAVGYPLPEFSMALRGFSTSLYMIGVWLACTVPVMLFYFFFVSAFLPAHPPGMPMSLSAEFLAGLTGSLADTVIAITTTAGMAYGIRSMIQDWQKSRH